MHRPEKTGTLSSEMVHFGPGGNSGRRVSVLYALIERRPVHKYHTRSYAAARAGPGYIPATHPTSGRGETTQSPESDYEPRCRWAIL